MVRAAENTLLTIETACEILKLDEDEATGFLKELEHMGYVEQSSITGVWSVCIRGKLLLTNKSSQFYKVSSMKKQLQKLLERVRNVNASNEYTENVLILKVTSEYPFVKPNSGIHIKYSVKTKDLSEQEYEAIADSLRERRTRNFDNYTQYLAYPETALHQFLKSRSHILKLDRVELDEMAIIEGEVVYTYDPKLVDNHP